ncbi:hypothetical protein Tco_1240086, partial [Tanacetum coccineum]
MFKPDAQPFNSHPFELESLIAKNGNYKSNKQGSSTPKFPLGFTQSDGGEKQHDFSDVNKPEFSVHHESKSIQSSQVKEDEAPRKIALYVQIVMWLCKLIANWDAHAIVMGDFNEVREAAERSGTAFNER